MTLPHAPAAVRCVRLLPGLCSALSALGVSHAAGGVLEVHVARIGFPTLTAGDVVRRGQWTPVVVDLDLINQRRFDGSMQVGQFDVDGDECYERIAVHVRAETGGGGRRYLYMPANPRPGRGQFAVELFSEEGEAVQVLSSGELTFQARPPEPPTIIGDDDLLILSISTGAIGRVKDLVGPERGEDFLWPVHVAHMSPTELPELWFGLEAVDFVVWDDAHPERLTRRQRAALLEWVRQGGTLLLAASQSAGLLKTTDPFGKLLPVEIGDLVTVENLPGLRKALLQAPPPQGGRRLREETAWWNDPFPARVPVAACTLRRGAAAVPNEISVGTVLAERRLGRGHLIFSPVLLKDLFSGEGSPTEFFRRVFHLGVRRPTDVEPTRVSLFPHVVSAVGFATSGLTYLLVAAGFSLAYVVVATLGSWSLLGTRGWRHHSWTAFGLVSVGASVLSLFAVNTIRGLGRGDSVHQIVIVDVDAGQRWAYATAFFGLKTGMDKVLDLWLPRHVEGATEPGMTNCYLRPLPPGDDLFGASGSFADPVDYRLVPSSAVIERVRVRATLKRFEGRWDGSLKGTLTGSVVVRAATIVQGSYLINDLGVDLTDCLLLHAPLDLNRTGAPRSRSIYAYPIGDLPSDGRKIDLAARCHPPAEDGRAVPAGTVPEGTVRQKPRLADAQKAWAAKFRGTLANLGSGSLSEVGSTLGQEKNALLLLSTVGDYDPTEATTIGARLLGTVSWSSGPLRHLDLRGQLSRHAVVLIGFAADPGPVRLFRRMGDRPYRMLSPDREKSWTLYRIRIPVQPSIEPEPVRETEKPVH